MASTDKSTFNRFQSLVTILTPIIVAVGGFYGYVLQKEVAEAEAKATAAQTQIAEIETSIRNVEAMETYFKMMGGENNAEAKMAARFAEFGERYAMVFKFDTRRVKSNTDWFRTSAVEIKVCEFVSGHSVVSFIQSYYRTRAQGSTCVNFVTGSGSK